MRHRMRAGSAGFRRSMCVAAIIVYSLMPRLALAQASVESWTGLNTARLQTVYVREGSGADTKGQLLSLSPDSLLLIVNGHERRIARMDVVSLETRDSLKNGAWTGAIVGVVFGGIAAGLSDCPGEEASGSCAAFRALSFASGVGVYAALGTGIDALIRGRSKIYVSPSMTRAGGGSLLAASSTAQRPRALMRLAVSW